MAFIAPVSGRERIARRGRQQTDKHRNSEDHNDDGAADLEHTQQAVVSHDPLAERADESLAREDSQRSDDPIVVATPSAMTAVSARPAASVPLASA
jgi:hypothetical protein